MFPFQALISYLVTTGWILTSAGVIILNAIKYGMENGKSSAHLKFELSTDKM